MNKQQEQKYNDLVNKYSSKLSQAVFEVFSLEIELEDAKNKIQELEAYIYDLKENFTPQAEQENNEVTE